MSQARVTSKSIAVLPFVNMSLDQENEYFSDGITEEIINALTTIDGLKVISRTSAFAYKGKNEDVRKIGQVLGVASILEGSVRKSGSKVRITAQLIDVQDGIHFWSNTFDRELTDVFGLQDEISLLIADQVRQNYGHLDIDNSLTENHTRNVLAFDLYHKGRYHQLKWDTTNFKKAIQFYEEAIIADPKYPLPYCGVALCYSYLFYWGAIGKEEASYHIQTSLQKVRDLDNQIPEYHHGLATYAIMHNWDYQVAHSEFKKVLELNPSYTDTLEGLAGLYILSDEFDIGLELIERALDLNPLSSNHHFMKGNILYFSGDYPNAMLSFEKTLDLDPGMQLAVERKLQCLILMGKLDESSETLGVRDFSRFQALDRGYHGNAISTLSEDVEDSLQTWKLYFSVYQKDDESALSYLEDGLQRRVGIYSCFMHDPFLKPIRNHPRYQQLLGSYGHQQFDASPLKSTQKAEAAKLSASDIKTFSFRLDQLLSDQKVYCDPYLTLNTLSEKMDLHANKLSWLINFERKKNFNELINSYRVEHFKKMALDPAYAHLTLLGLAYESGFNSKTVFNNYFKKSAGVTPKEWVKQNQQGKA